VALVYIPDPIFWLAIFALRKRSDYLVSTARAGMAMIAGLIVHDLADLELAEQHLSRSSSGPTAVRVLTLTREV
jgi:hypothetical protein